MSLAERVRDVLRDAAVVSEDSFTWEGRTVHHDPGRIRFIAPSAGYPGLTAEIAQAVYDRHYTRPDEGRGAYAVVPDRLLQQEFVARLAQANGSRWSWVPGFRVVAREGEKLRVQSADGDDRFVTPEEFDGPEGAGRVRLAKGAPVVQPGWYHVRGELDHPFSGGETLRLYWNVCAQGAAPLVGSVTRELNAAGLPFHFKVTDDPQLFRRADAGVLYLPAASWDAAGPALSRVHAAVAPWLKEATPLLTHPLAPGLGLAEDPGGGESFGMHRARVLAEGLVDAWRTGAPPGEAVEARFRAVGLDPDRPHLGRADGLDRTLTLAPLELPSMEA